MRSGSNKYAPFRYLIIIIISYFLPITIEVTNTETTVVYVLRVTRLYRLDLHKNLQCIMWVLRAIYWICCEGLGSQTDEAMSSVHSGPICVPVSGRVRPHGGMADEKKVLN